MLNPKPIASIMIATSMVGFIGGVGLRSSVKPFSFLVGISIYILKQFTDHTTLKPGTLLGFQQINDELDLFSFLLSYQALAFQSVQLLLLAIVLATFSR